MYKHNSSHTLTDSTADPWMRSYFTPSPWGKGVVAKLSPSLEDFFIIIVINSIQLPSQAGLLPRSTKEQDCFRSPLLVSSTEREIAFSLLMTQERSVIPAKCSLQIYSRLSGPQYLLYGQKLACLCCTWNRRIKPLLSSMEDGGCQHWA